MPSPPPPDDDAPVPLSVDYAPRPQFVPYHHRRERFAAIVAHRRAGKTLACLHDLQLRASNRPGRPRMAYLAPFLRQAKDIAWDHLIAALGDLRYTGTQVRSSELRIDYPNGGRIQLYGADNPDALRGLRLDGVVLDEYADMDPRVWPEIVRPALADDGFATFIGTPRGRNGFHDLWLRAQTEFGWLAMMLKASQTGLIPESELALIRREMSEEQYAQEFECSFDGAVIGAYYARLIADAEREGRIGKLPSLRDAPVWTAWDLGMRDRTAIWFAQMVGDAVQLIDCYEASGQDLAHYVRLIARQPYCYAGHIVPQDALVRELGTGRTRLDVLRGLGLSNIRVAPIHRIEDGIEAVRLMLPRCRFDAKKCARGIEALRGYRAEGDGGSRWLPGPVHDWTSHAADAVRYLAMTIDHAGSC